MSDLKAQMMKARGHIQRKEYEKARAILKNIDHPTAKKWLAKIDEVSPTPKRSRRYIAIGVLVAVVIIGAIIIVVTRQGIQRDGEMRGDLLYNCQTSQLNYNCYQNAEMIWEIAKDDVVWCFEQYDAVFDSCLLDRGVGLPWRIR